MRTRIFLATTTAFTLSLTAQQTETKGKMSASMRDAMAGKMAQCMANMPCEHSEITALVGKITQSFAGLQAGLQNEKDPAALAGKLAAHAALLKELEAKMQAMGKAEAAAPAEHKH